MMIRQLIGLILLAALTVFLIGIRLFDYHSYMQSRKMVGKSILPFENLLKTKNISFKKKCESHWEVGDVYSETLKASDFHNLTIIVAVRRHPESKIWGEKICIINCDGFMLRERRYDNLETALRFLENLIKEIYENDSERNV